MLPYTVSFRSENALFVSEDAPEPLRVMTHEVREKTQFTDLPGSERCLAALQAELEEVMREIPDQYSKYVKDRSAFFDALVTLYEDPKEASAVTQEFIEGIHKSRDYLHSLLTANTQ